MEDEPGFGGDPGAASNRWVNVTVCGLADFAFKEGPEDALLDPRLSWQELAIGVQASHFRAGSRAARGAVERSSGA